MINVADIEVMELAELLSLSETTVPVDLMDALWRARTESLVELAKQPAVQSISEDCREPFDQLATFLSVIRSEDDHFALWKDRADGAAYHLAFETQYLPEFVAASLDIASHGTASMDARAKSVIDELCRICSEHLMSVHNPFVLTQLGEGIDAWSQATGIEVSNPTGIFTLRADALLLGWRRPRITGPADVALGEPMPLPSIQALSLLLLDPFTQQEQVERLIMLVEQGMNLELARELAASKSIQINIDRLERAADSAKRKRMVSEFPKIVDQAKTFSKALGRAAAAIVTCAELMVDHQEVERRKGVCLQCERYEPRTHRCKECGCKLKAKLKMATEGCPLRKWSA